MFEKLVESDAKYGASFSISCRESERGRTSSPTFWPRRQSFAGRKQHLLEMVNPIERIEQLVEYISGPGRHCGSDVQKQIQSSINRRGTRELSSRAAPRDPGRAW